MRLTATLVGVLGVACGSSGDYASKEDVAELRERLDSMAGDLAQLRTRYDAIATSGGAAAVAAKPTPSAVPVVPAAPAAPATAEGWWCYKHDRCWKSAEECQFALRSDVYVRRDPSKEGVVLYNHERNGYELVKWDDIRPALGSGKYTYSAGTPEIEGPAFKGECISQRGAGCFSFEVVLDKTQQRECYISMTLCEERKKNMLSLSAADYKILAGCAPG